MRPFDPVDFFHSALNLLLRLGWLLITPLLWIFGLIAAITFSMIDLLLGKSDGESEESAETEPKPGVYGFMLELASIPRAIFDNPRVGRFLQSDFVERITDFLGGFFQISFFQPVKWLAAIAGMAMTWGISREWGRVLIVLSPLIFVLAITPIVWYGGRMDRLKLYNQYLDLADRLPASWDTQPEKTKSSSLTPTSLSSSATAPDSTALRQQERQQAINAYCEMLYRRAMLLLPNNDNQYVVASILLSRGATELGRSTMRRMAPDHRVGLPKAHAAMAASLLSEYRKEANQAVLELFVHHADAALNWRDTPIDTLIALSDLYWQRNNRNRSLQVLQVAAGRDSRLYTLLFERAAMTDDVLLQSRAKQLALAQLRDVLIKQPRNDQARVQMAQILSTSDDGLPIAEKLLAQGLALGPNKYLTRSLSEVYRLAFLRKFLKSNRTSVELDLLDIAIRIDPTNPLIAEQIEDVMGPTLLETPDLESAMQRILTQGNASVATHATIAQYYLRHQRIEQATVHLEQVYQAVPGAIRFVQQLTELYLKTDRLDDALKVASMTVEVLEETEMLGEKYSAELLDLLGDSYLRLGRVDDAISTYQKCLKLSEKRVETKRRLATAYRQAGNQEAADFQENEADRLSVDQLVEQAEQTPPPDVNETHSESEREDTGGTDAVIERQD